MSQVLEAIETVEAFRLRARDWIKANLGPIQPEDQSQHCENDEAELVAVARDRRLQRKLFDGGFAGICFPVELGGQGLSPAHNRAFNEELSGHEFPSRFAVPTMTPCAAVLLEFGTPEQKAKHIPAILKGDEVWVQMLSEPGGGSDVAGASTGAVRDGDDWVLNGSKVWTSRAWWADWGLCLARTNWNVPKHQGLTVFLLPLNAPGVEIHRIERLSGETEACQEFLTDVRIPDSYRVGEIDAGWAIGTRWMYHERVGSNSPYVTRPIGLNTEEAESGSSIVQIAAKAGRLADPAAQELIGESRSLEIVMHELKRRLAAAAASGKANTDNSAIGRLAIGMAGVRQATIAFDLAGSDAAAWSEEEDEGSGPPGMQFLMRQVICIGGGTTEIARNVIAERVLGMPREPTGDKNIPYRDIPRGPKRG
jgi:alkylation response protein AidB-like acyl-CoA dehydrogenase